MDDAHLTPQPGLAQGCRFAVQSCREDEVVVAVIGDLDPSSARVLLELVEHAIGTPPTSRTIEVDLRRLRACSNSGVRALAACAELGARLRDGLHFRVGIDPECSDYWSDESVTLRK